MNFYWTRSIPIHQYIQKGVGIWELGRTRDTGTKETIVLTNGVFTLNSNIMDLNPTMYSVT